MVKKRTDRRRGKMRLRTEPWIISAVRNAPRYVRKIQQKRIKRNFQWEKKKHDISKSGKDAF